jgi:hypothetical protein
MAFCTKESKKLTEAGCFPTLWWFKRISARRRISLLFPRKDYKSKVMPTSLTLHFHLKHFKESGLPFSEYAMLLMYEQKEDWEIIDFKEMFHLSERTVTRMRIKLTDSGFLKKVNRHGRFCLTDKMYAK